MDYNELVCIRNNKFGLYMYKKYHNLVNFQPILTNEYCFLKRGLKKKNQKVKKKIENFKYY